MISSKRQNNKDSKVQRVAPSQEQGKPVDPDVRGQTEIVMQQQNKQWKYLWICITVIIVSLLWWVIGPIVNKIVADTSGKELVPILRGSIWGALEYVGFLATGWALHGGWDRLCNKMAR